MKTTLVDPAADASARMSTNAAGANLHDAWLRELEQAQLAWWDAGRGASGHSSQAGAHEAGGSDGVRAERPGHRTPELAGSCCAVLADLGAACRASSHAGEGARPQAPAADAPADQEAEAAEAAEADAGSRGNAGSVPQEGRPANAADVERPTVEPLTCAGPVSAADCRAAQCASADDAPALEREPAEDEAAPSPAAASRDPLPPRAVHMAVDGPDAKVWIRDSRLAQESAGQIVSSLAIELAARGLRLRMLAVNGRVAFESSQSMFSQRKG